MYSLFCSLARYRKHLVTPKKISSLIAFIEKQSSEKSNGRNILAVAHKYIWSWMLFYKCTLKIGHYSQLNDWLWYNYSMTSYSVSGTFISFASPSFPETLIKERSLCSLRVLISTFTRSAGQRKNETQVSNFLLDIYKRVGKRKWWNNSNCKIFSDYLVWTASMWSVYRRRRV